MALRITPEEYLKLERASQQKHEYYAGEIFAMTGGFLHAQLRQSPCRALFGLTEDTTVCWIHHQ